MPAPPYDDIRDVLQEAMDEAGYSQRGLARELQRRHPRGGGDERAGIESWRNTIGRYLAADEDRRQIADDTTAKLLSKILNRPPDFFVRRRGGGSLHEENALLRQEVARLRAELGRRRQRAKRDRQ